MDPFRTREFEHTEQRFARHAHVILTTLWLITYRLVRDFFTRDTYPGFIFGYYSLKCVTPGFFELRILKF